MKQVNFFALMAIVLTLFGSCIDGRMMNVKVHKLVLKNGLTILVYPSSRIPKVKISMWHNVGSKDEKDKEKGIAHLIEHMMFKGNGKTLTESDMTMLAHMLSAYTNAATSYDYTNYYFSAPTHHWKEFMPIMANIMSNTEFNDQLLNSEMKAVIQELKMIRDNYTRTMFFDLLTAAFPDHPYHYPVIGFKQDLWNLHGKDLKAFYKKHYWPNSATLVVTGDVDPEEVFALAQEHLGHIEPNYEYSKEQFYLNEDIVSKGITLYRDVQQPIKMLAFRVPGTSDKVGQYFDVLELLLGNLKSSTLYKLLVDQKKLINGMQSGYVDLFEHGLFYIIYQPFSEEAIPEVESIITKEISDIAQCGIQEKELEKAIKQARMKYYNLFEDIDEQADRIGRCYLATGDEYHVFNYLKEPTEQIGKKVQELVKQYMRPSIMHHAVVLPLPESEREHWQEMQAKSDDEDNRFLSARPRTEPLQEPVYSKKITAHEPVPFKFPKPNKAVLSNGVKLFTYHNSTTPKVDIVIEFKAKQHDDPEDKQGLYTFLAEVMTEGTKKYSAEQLAQELDSRGVMLGVAPGKMVISLLREDIEDGLEFALEILTNCVFPEQEVEKVRTQLFAAIKNFWDNPNKFTGQLIKDVVYKGHPWSKNALGSKESIAAITRDDLVDAYKKWISPDGAKVAIVGDIEGLELEEILEKTIGRWHGPKVADTQYPQIKPVESAVITYPINRDQTVLAFAASSISRFDQDFDKLLLFDQIFGSGVLNSMNSRLFALREETGLFYTIGGATLSGAGEQPGIVQVITIVSNDRLQEAENAIKKTINTVAPTITEKELKEARYAVVNSLINCFESNGAMAKTFLFLDKYKLPDDFFDTRNETLKQIKLKDVSDAASKLLNTDNMITVKVGRSEHKKTLSEANE